RDAQAFLIGLGGVRGVGAGDAAPHVGLVADGPREGNPLVPVEDGLQDEHVGQVHAALERVVETVDVAGLHAVAEALERRAERVASSSSTIAGPSTTSARSARRRIGVRRHPCSGPKYTSRRGDSPAGAGWWRSTTTRSGTRGRSGIPWATRRRLTSCTGSSGP